MGLQSMALLKSQTKLVTKQQQKNVLGRGGKKIMAWQGLSVRHGGGENLEAGAPSPASDRGNRVGWAGAGAGRR